jgi:hypothetical protein
MERKKDEAVVVVVVGGRLRLVRVVAGSVSPVPEPLTAGDEAGEYQAKNGVPSSPNGSLIRD